MNVQNRHITACVSTTAARKPSLSHNASVTSNIYFFLSSFLLCNFLSGSVTVERWINEQGLIWNTWEKLQLKTECVFKKVWFLPVAATAQSPAAEPSRTPASWAKKMTCMFASCAWEQSWTTRYWWWQSKIAGVHTLWHEMRVCICMRQGVYWPHPVLSCSFSRSMASTWWCLMHTQSMKSLSAWTIRTQGENRGPRSPGRQGWGRQWGKPCSLFTR